MGFDPPEPVDVELPLEPDEDDPPDDEDDPPDDEDDPLDDEEDESDDDDVLDFPSVELEELLLDSDFIAFFRDSDG